MALKAGTALALVFFVATDAAAQSTGAQQSCNAPEYRQLDFWIGTWDVLDSSGTRLGTNSITRILAGCALHERWVSSRGFVGESLSAYDSVTRRWHQTWVDEQANVWKIDGSFVAGRMVMSRSARDPADSTRVIEHRWTWVPKPNGGLRQTWEISSDRGRSWTMQFDGRYTRRR